MRVLAVIPARYASTRFPGKPLATLGGESIISHVYHRVRRTEGIEDVVVATDDESICDHVESFAEEGTVMMTSDQHRTGEKPTDAAAVSRFFLISHLFRHLFSVHFCSLGFFLNLLNFLRLCGHGLCRTLHTACNILHSRMLGIHDILKINHIAL